MSRCVCQCVCIWWLFLPLGARERAGRVCSGRQRGKIHARFTTRRSSWLFIFWHWVSGLNGNGNENSENENSEFSGEFSILALASVGIALSALPQRCPGFTTFHSIPFPFFPFGFLPFCFRFSVFGLCARFTAHPHILAGISALETETPAQPQPPLLARCTSCTSARCIYVSAYLRRRRLLCQRRDAATAAALCQSEQQILFFGHFAIAVASPGAELS